jgi:hypothetical protein
MGNFGPCWCGWPTAGSAPDENRDTYGIANKRDRCIMALFSKPNSALFVGQSRHRVPGGRGLSPNLVAVQ